MRNSISPYPLRPLRLCVLYKLYCMLETFIGDIRQSMG